MQDTNFDKSILTSSNSKNLAQSFSEVILSSLPNGITILNTKGEIIFANDSAKKVLNTAHFPQKRKELVSMYEIYDEKGNQLSENDLPSQHVLRTKKPQERLLRFWHRDVGIETWSLIKSQPLIENGQLIGVITVFNDLTSLKKSQARLAFLNSLSEKLITSLNYDIRLRKLAEQIVPTVADWCAIDMVTENNTLKRVVIAHKDPRKIKLAEKMNETFPPDPQSKTGAYGVLKTGKLEFYPSITDKMVEKLVKQKQLQSIIKRIGLRSVVMLPLISRNKKLGVITFAHSESQRQFVQEDIGFLKNIASKAALLCDNGKMYTTVLQGLKEQQKIEKQLRDSRNTLSLALEASNMGVWDWDITTNKLLWSKQLEFIHKLKHKRFKGTYSHFLSLIHKDDRDKFEEDIKNAFISLKDFETEYRLKQSKDSEERWVYGSGEVLLDEKGKPVRMIGIGMDITDRKHYETDILEREKKFRSIFNSVIEAMLITDDKGMIFETNKASDSLFNIRRDEVLLKQFHDILDGKNEDVFTKSWEELKKTGQSQCELTILCTDGQKRIFDVLLKKHVVAHRHLIVFKDITDHKHEAKRREHFLSIASHELRSPLTNIKVYLELLKKTYPQSEGKALEYISKTEQKVDMVTKLISDLLDVTRIREGKLELYFEIVNIRSYVQNILKDLQLVVNDHKIIYDNLEDATVVIDKIRIAQVIINLVTNAAKYSEKGSTITVSSKISNNMLTISVTDEGVGLLKKDIPNLFTIYNQGNTTNKSGLGLGLYISKQIVMQHNGEMSVTSTVGKGSTFSFYIPVQKDYATT